MVDLVSDYRALYDMNLSLIKAVQNEEWVLFIDSIEPYLLTLQALLAKSTCESPSAQDKERIRQLLQHVIENTETIQRRVAEQKTRLLGEICALRHASKVSQHYSLYKVQCTEMDALRARY